MAVMAAQVDGSADVRERLEARLLLGVLGEAMNRPVQVRNGGLYLRGLIEDGARKSLEPLVLRLGGEAEYQSMQQFLADSPWDRRWWCGRSPSGIWWQEIDVEGVGA